MSTATMSIVSSEPARRLLEMVQVVSLFMKKIGLPHDAKIDYSFKVSNYFVPLTCEVKARLLGIDKPLSQFTAGKEKELFRFVCREFKKRKVYPGSAERWIFWGDELPPVRIFRWGSKNLCRD